MANKESESGYYCEFFLNWHYGPINVRTNKVRQGESFCQRAHVREKAEDYEQSVRTGVFIRVYLAGRQESRENELPLSSDEIASKICQLMEAGIGDGEPREVKSMVRKSPYPDHIPAI